MLVDTVTTGDWDLICKFCHYSYKTNLPSHIYNQVYSYAWTYTDAYGGKGYIPPQGYDWSGFRDSSANSTKEVANAIRVNLAKHGITQFEVESC